jgi:hypothetical protein
MHRQNVVPGAAEALARIGEAADIVVLTNIGDEHQAGRVRQLEAFHIRHACCAIGAARAVQCSSWIEELRPSAAVFVDDLAVHHESVAKHAPAVWRLHMIAEPRVAAHMPAAPHAHARIDDWERATDWILARFAEGPAGLDRVATPVETAQP